MFGMKTKWNRLRRLRSVLDRKIPIDALDAFAAAASSRNKRTDQLAKVAFGFDTSAFLRIGNHAKSVDILDYLGGRHDGPLILPVQVIQESWNNLSVVETIASKLKKKFEDLKAEAEKVDHSFGDFAGRMDALLREFGTDYGYVYDEGNIHRTLQLVEILQRKAFVSQVPRIRFHDIAQQRKRTKTPPGFMDEGDGDFFTWIEFLNGLLEARDAGRFFDHAVLVTHDKKVDWSRAGIAHPVLKAEVRALLGVSFDVWRIEELSSAIALELEPPAAKAAQGSGATTEAAGDTGGGANTEDILSAAAPPTAVSVEMGDKA